ncbi:M6 family metalloprotease domain-containing protein [Ornithinimicrobium humiphilum]|uniref:M6 family metalloprotease-like protein n=1 Tax=Ornithinimicrobium humiphilum TaxID=125288 RepID=A0A543KR28_9MICO|nr:M6 family metalloprotease domain-containing protein [Ornithinimicrobium humiphilum]TQM97533.1 M6 family metalloprotease-like protein [Ornithinimicrobium humiphilum]
MRTHGGARLRRLGRALRPAVLVTGALGLSLVAPTSMAVDTTDDAPSVHDPVDPGDWVNPDDTTWDDYRAVPGRPSEWVDGTVTGTERHFKAAVVLVDFTDQPMLLTQQAGAHVFGNPQAGWEPIERDEVADWWEDYLGTPNEYNNNHTINEYWMENSNGRYSVEIDAFGPYQLPGKLHEYGLSGYAPVTGPNSVCPAGDTCNKNIRTDGFAAWYADQGPTIYQDYDVLFWVTAGHDESGTWQEFGEMKFQTKEDVPAEYGPPGATEGPVYNAFGNEIPNWSPTRYVEWTSWAAAANHWPNAQSGGVIPNSTQAESSGQSIFQHEMSHLLGIADNYNNPFAVPTVRTYSGHWDMLSRGTFNGPGGTHQRWKIPNEGASGMGSQFSLRNKMRLNMLDAATQVVNLTRDQLTAQGVARATVSARSVNRPDRLAGFNVALSGGDLSNCTAEGLVGDRAWLCDRGGYNNYTIEVVDRVGMDSFVPSSGVHLAKTKNQDRAPFIWTIDANPEDINWVDFVRPNGDRAMVTLGDPRQLQDAMFRAGTGSGSLYEYVDEANRLHFYVLERIVDDEGVLTYDVAVRSLDGSGPQARGVSVGGSTAAVTEGGTTASISVPVSNTGAAGAGVHDSDVYRVEATLDGAGWTMTQPYEVVAAAAGETVSVPLHLARTTGGKGTLTVTVTSESDPSKSETVVLDVQTLVLAEAQSVLAGLVADGALDRGVAQSMQAFLDQVEDAIAKGKTKQAEQALDRMVSNLSRVRDEAARQTITELVAILRQG